MSTKSELDHVKRQIDRVSRLSRRAVMTRWVSGGAIAALLLGSVVLKLPIILVVLGIIVVAISFVLSGHAIGSALIDQPDLLELERKKDELEAEHYKNIMEGNF